MNRAAAAAFATACLTAADAPGIGRADPYRPGAGHHRVGVQPGATPSVLGHDRPFDRSLEFDAVDGSTCGGKRLPPRIRLTRRHEGDQPGAKTATEVSSASYLRVFV